MITNTTQTFEAYLLSARRRNFVFAMSLTRNADDAEDLVQEAGLRALRALDTLKGDEIPDPWFRQIIRNCFIDSKRYQSRRPLTTSLDAIQEINPSFDVPDPAEYKIVPEGDVEIGALKAAIDKLTPHQQELVMAALHGRTCQELCQMFRCGAITVRTRLHRAHRSLRRHLMASKLGASIYLQQERSAAA